MKILGISDHFISGAAVIIDGRVVAAVSEERLVRKKMVITTPFVLSTALNPLWSLTLVLFEVKPVLVLSPFSRCVLMCVISFVKSLVPALSLMLTLLLCVIWLLMCSTPLVFIRLAYQLLVSGC